MPSAVVIDLFAGCGGGTTAAHLAGCPASVSVEIDETCCSTLRKNWSGHKVIQNDVTKLNGRDLREEGCSNHGQRLIVIGGPPCQPFSKASYWTDPGDDSKYRRARERGEFAVKPDPITTPKPDARRDLIGEFLRITAEAKADGFVMENVRSILHPRNKKQFNAFTAKAQELGYSLQIVKANATHFGVPQKRERVFVLGSRFSIPNDPTREISADVNHPINSKVALEPFESDEYAEPEEIVTGRWAQHLQDIPPGWNYKFHTEWAKHPNPTFLTETRFWNFLLKLSPDQPSWTINANPGPWVGPFHWTSRRLRIPELAALQGFPNGYFFAGSRREKVRQIGNAVPAPMEAAMIRSVADTMAA